MRLTKKVENGYFIFCEIDASDGKPNIQEHVKKLGLYEDVDESPEHLAKIKRALEIIKEKQIDVRMFIIYDLENYNKLQKNDYCKLTKTEDDLLKEVLL